MRVYVENMDDVKHKIEEIGENKIFNIYHKDGRWQIRYNENGRKTYLISNIEYMPTVQGFEMECLIREKFYNKIEKIKKSYHGGKRRAYTGGMKIFNVVERDGSLPDEGAEFVSKHHKAMDNEFYHWFKIFNDKIELYYNDRCGGHIHISGWVESDASYVYGAFRAYAPMLMAIFGNGVYGLHRRNHYSGLYGLFDLYSTSRDNIYPISDMHYELRFYDAEVKPYKWFFREMFNDAIVHIAKNVKLGGIGRYVPPMAWWDVLYHLHTENYANKDSVKRMFEELKELAMKTKYPYTNELTYNDEKQKEIFENLIFDPKKMRVRWEVK